MTGVSEGERAARVVAWVLMVFYALGIPPAIYLEIAHHTLSRRFDLPPWLIYATAAFQAVCTVGILVRGFAPWAALGLTLTTLGAIGAHLRIGSPHTAISAVVFTVLQAWYAWVPRPSRGRHPAADMEESP